MTTAKTGCLSSPLVMNPRLGAKERSKSTGWSSSTVICVRGAGQGCFFRYKTGSISVTGSLSAARTRVYDTNPPLVGLVRPVSASYAPAMSFSFSSTPHRGRSLQRPPGGAVSHQNSDRPVVGTTWGHAGGCQAGQVAQPSHVREVTTPGTVVYRPERLRQLSEGEGSKLD